MPFEILFRDDHLIAINKPPRMHVHRTRMSSDRHVVLQTLRDQIGQYVYPAHRLDRGTSGVLLLALDSDTCRGLMTEFENRRAEKHYLAVVRGWTEEAERIDRPVSEYGRRGERREAVTDYRRLATVEVPEPVSRYDTARYSLVEARPLTGRHQQLRSHFRKIDHPILGDSTHGDRHHNRFFRDRFGIRRLMLHARRLRIRHPVTGEPLTLTAPVDEHFIRVAEAFGWTDRLGPEPPAGN